MLKVMARRVIILVPVLFLVSLISYSLVLFIPGDAAAIVAGETASTEEIEAVRERLGLDDPFLVQYGRWLGGAVQGDFGETLVRRESVVSSIMIRLPITIQLALVGLMASLVIGVPLGILAALRAGRPADRVTTFVASLGMAAPQFWIAQIMIIVFAFRLGWFASSGWVPFSEDPWEWFRHIIIPGIALGLAPAATVARQLRSQLQRTLNDDFVRTARAAGLSEGRVVGKHALRSAITPVVTLVGLQFGTLLGGTVIIESIFGIPGLGTLALRAVNERDIPLLQGIILFTALVMVTINLVMDLLYLYLNPKLREAAL